MARLTQIGEEVWLAEGPTISFYGFPYPTRMAIIRLPGNELWLWSPIALDADLRSEIETLGRPRYVVEPNKLHHLALTEWISAFDGLELYAPPGLAEKRSDLSFVGELTDEAPAGYSDTISQVRIEGSFAMTEVVFFHHPSRTCLVGDLIQKHDPDAAHSWQKWIMKADGLAGPDGSTPREWRATFIHRQVARAAIEKVIALNPERLVIAHGTCANTDGAEILRSSLSWLLPRTDEASKRPNKS